MASLCHSGSLRSTRSWRAMLYYAEDFARLIQSVPGADQCRDWHAMVCNRGHQQ